MENSAERIVIPTLEEMVEYHLHEALELLGFDLTQLDNVDTPRRIAKMWARETARNINNHNLHELDRKMTLFDNPYPESVEMIIVKDIPFSSMCSHHFMPFMGKATVAYIPNEKIIGLSKIPRIVHYFSKKPQVQENLTAETAEYLHEVTDAHYVAVFLHDTTHTCMSCRGIELPSSTDTFYHISNTIGGNANKLREEFFARVRRG